MVRAMRGSWNINCYIKHEMLAWTVPAVDKERVGASHHPSSLSPGIPEECRYKIHPLLSAWLVEIEYEVTHCVLQFENIERNHQLHCL